MKRLIAILALAGIALAAAACASTNADAGQPGAIDPNAPRIVARDITFTTPEVEVPAGSAFQLVFDNEDGAPHNVAIRADAGGAQVFRGEIFSGATTRAYAIPALAAGSYTFTCDVHPGMHGTLIAK